MKNVEIFTFQSGREGDYASSHYFETPDGIFLFDGQLLRDEAHDLLMQIQEDIPERKIRSIFITSPRPEHYASLGVITNHFRPDVYATKATERRIASGAGTRLARLKEAYGPRAPDAIVLPEHTIRSAQQFHWGPQVLQFLDVGARERAGNLVCWLPEKKRLITGDLVFNKVHPHLEEIDIDSWIRSLDILSTFGARTIYPGHGPVVTGDVLVHLKRYLEHFRVAVAYFAKSEDRSNDELINGVLALMTDKYPDYELPENLMPGIAVEFERQAGRKAA